jgi:hypothetical protein
VERSPVWLVVEEIDVATNAAEEREMPVQRAAEFSICHGRVQKVSVPSPRGKQRCDVLEAVRNQLLATPFAGRVTPIDVLAAHTTDLPVPIIHKPAFNTGKKFVSALTKCAKLTK